MQFGHFDDEAREYVITTPHTPYPWINYLGSQEFFSLISHTAGGYSFYRDAKMRRLTRYRYNNTPVDDGGRIFTINDGGDVLEPRLLPVQEGAGPLRDPPRNGLLAHHGRSRRPRGLDALLCAGGHQRGDPPGNAHQYVRRCQVSNALQFRRVVPLERGGRPDQLPAQPVDRRGGDRGRRDYSHKTEYRERRDHYAVYGVNAPIAGFDTDRDTYLGAQNSFAEAAVPASGKSANSVASGWYPIGSHSVDVTLAPGESKTFTFTLGLPGELQG